METLETSLPKAALDACQKFLLDTYSRMPAVAFAVDSVAASQKAYSVIKEINKFLKDNSKIELSLYNLTKELPIMLPHCSIYNSIELGQFDGYLVCTSLQTLFSAYKVAKRAKLFYYVYDINELKQAPPQALQSLLKIGVPIFARTKDHKKAVEKLLNSKIVSTTVYDFEMEKIFECLNISI